MKIGDKVYGESVTALGKYSNTQRKDFRLYQNYPNPFNPMTKIKYEIGTTGITKLIVYNILGQNVKTIINEYKNPGTYEIQFDAPNLPSGIYYYRLESGSFSKVNKMLV